MNQLPARYLVTAPSQAGTDEQLVTLWLRKFSNEGTRTMYASEILRFRRCLPKPLPAVTLEDILDYRESLSSFAVNTIRRKMATVKSLFTFAVDIGYLRFNPAKPVSLEAAKDALNERILEETQVHAMIALEPSARNRSMLKLMYLSGARVSEITGLTWGDVTKDDSGAVLTIFGKGGKTRFVRVPPGVLPSENSDRDEHGGSPIFRSREGGSLSTMQVNRIVRSAARRAGIRKPVSPHWLRHAHASHALDRGAPVHLVKETLGHASLTTTSRYTHARPGESSGAYLAA